MLPSLLHARSDPSTAPGAACRMPPAVEFSAPVTGLHQASSSAIRCPPREGEGALHAGVHDSERLRIAQQIHDDLGGILTGLKACIAVVLERASRAGVVPEPLVLEAAALADLAFATVRTIAFNLRPPVFEHMDLWEALEWRVAGLSRRSDLVVEYFFDAALQSTPFGEERALSIFRFICEALTNVEKHAHAATVGVRLSASEGVLTVLITDDGIGIADELGRRGGTLGMAGMRQRARECGGELVIRSGVSGGTMVRLTVPVARGNGG